MKKIFSMMLLSSLGQLSFAGPFVAGGPPVHINVILSCSTETARGVKYQLLVGPPKSIRPNDASSDYPVGMYKFENGQCQSVQGFDWAKIAIGVSGKFNVSFYAPRDQSVPEFHGSGWNITIPTEDAALTGLNKGKFLSPMYFQIGGDPDPVMFYCDNKNMKNNFPPIGCH